MFRTGSSRRRGQRAPSPASAGGPGSARPQPLHIVKRPSLKMDAAGAPDSRRSSADTNGSLRSAAEPPGGDAPLTVPKRRAHRGSQVFSS